MEKDQTKKTPEVSQIEKVLEQIINRIDESVSNNQSGDAADWAVVLKYTTEACATMAAIAALNPPEGD